MTTKFINRLNKYLMQHLFKNMGYVLVIATLLTSCGKNPPTTSQPMQQLLEKEQKLIQALKSLWKIAEADHQAEIAIVEGLVPADTPKHKLRKRLFKLLEKIENSEIDLATIKSGNYDSWDLKTDLADLFEEKNILQGTTKTIELLQVRREKYELFLGIDKQKKQAA